MSTRQSKPRSLSPKCCQMHKTENYTQVQIWCKKVHFTFHQILTNCIFLSKPDMSDILLQDDALVRCNLCQRKDQSYFISQHWQHEQVYVQSSAPLFSGLCHFDVDAQSSGRGEVACWCETHCWCWCAAHICAAHSTPHTAHQHTAGVKLPGFAALRTHFARDRFNLCSLALIGESLISFCQASFAMRSRFSEEQKENWAEFSRNSTTLLLSSTLPP